ncbi:MAG TPA: OmpA family protein, partial [Chitinophagales bacterium]|nr:OmpA family protein [Chitinophagales bacterium]
QLSAHTDCRGSDVYNQTLSQKRAESVVQYLISKGISTNRLTAKGYGETMPIETCVCEKCNDEQHQINRRTTFKIVSE